MEKTFAELFVLAACGKLRPHQITDDLASLESFGTLHGRAEGLESALENSPALIKREDAAGEQAVENSSGNSSAR